MSLYADHIVRCRSALLRAAHSKLRNPDWAEDAVSETLLVAWERPPDFDEPARIQAWLFGILHHKLVDQVRRNGAENMIVAAGGWSDIERFQKADESAYADPQHCACSAQFVRGLAHALAELPLAHARAFLMWEAWGHSTDEICNELGVSMGNLRVMLCRARAKLRLGLQAHWA